MPKKHDNKLTATFSILAEGVGIYCYNLDTWINYLFFPILGQFIGVAFILCINYLYVTNINLLIKRFPLLDNVPLSFTVLLICVFPGFIIFCKSFCDFLLAYGALNPAIYVRKGKKAEPAPIQTHVNILKKRIFNFIVLWLILSVIFLASPLYLIVLPIIAVFLALVFQVFSLEEKSSAFTAIKRSFFLVKGNFIMTSFILLVSFLLTYILLPSLFVWGAEKIYLVKYLSIPVQKYIDILPYTQLADFVVQNVSGMMSAGGAFNFDIKFNAEMFDLAGLTVKLSISTVVTMFLLPLRSAWCTLLYKYFDSVKTARCSKNGKDD